MTLRPFLRALCNSPKAMLATIALFIGGAVMANIDGGGDGREVGVFAFSKSLCLGPPGTGANDPKSCDLAAVVPENQAVFYVFKITNPWGQPQQAITIEDALPAAFQKSGGLTCQLPNGGAVSVQPGASTNALGVVSLPVGETVICTLAGKFTGAGQYKNTATARNQFGFAVTGEVNTAILAAPPLGVDLAVTKTSVQSQVNVSSGTGIIDYTVTIKNNGPGAADIGAFFRLHDRMSLLPNSVAFRAELVSATCTATNGSNCLDSAGPSQNGQILVGTMAGTPLFNWGFANGQGVIASGGVLTIQIKVRIRKIAGIGCVLAPGADGVRNTVFFTLANDNSAFSEANPANNTATADVKLNTGETTQDAACGQGHLKVTKTQIDPPSGEIPWGNQVVYRITIKNQSVPAQAITINAGDLEDWVAQGINTPPFTRVHVATQCISSTQAGLCAQINGQIAASPSHVYSFYGEANKAWETAPGGAITIQPGAEVVIETSFIYKHPDCETVPAAANKPINNTVKVRYKATAFGATSANAPKVDFIQMASAQTQMQDQLPCQFTVTKSRIRDKKIADNYLHFGKPVAYELTFTSNEPDRPVGTVMDVLRINRGDYATGLAFNAQWQCTDNGKVSGYTPQGSVNGIVRHTSTPAQGSAAIDFRGAGNPPVFFKQGGVLTCKLVVKVSPPPANNPYCLNEDVWLENLALMDVTDPLNTNINWPPAGSYNPSSMTNPTPQNRNWAMAAARLPRCLDAMVNKSAKVDGLPSYSAPWTYQNGPRIGFAVRINNLARGTLQSSGPGFSPFNGVLATDQFAAPYQNMNTNVSGSNCAPNGFCQPSPASNVIGVRNLADGGQGIWNFQFPGTSTSQLIPGSKVRNCVTLTLSGLMNPAQGYFYARNGTPLSSACAEVPVIPTTKIRVTKLIEDTTGGNVTQGGPFGIKVTCTPYALFNNSGVFTMNAGATHTIGNVPVGSSCTIEETSLPPVPAAATAACQKQNPFSTAYWDSPQMTASTLNAPLNGFNNKVTIRNILRCQAQQTGTIQIRKSIRNWGPQFGPANVTFAVQCTPAANPASVTMQVATTPTTGSTQAPVGATCTITEQLPSFPTAAITYCNAIKPQGSMEPKWNAPLYTPSKNFTVQNGNNGIQVMNSWSCQPKAQPTTLTVTKQFGGDSYLQSIARSMDVEITAQCTPAANPATLSLNIPSGQYSGSLQVPTGAQCTLNEALTTIPKSAHTYCRGKTQHLRGRARWRAPTFSTPMPFNVAPGAQNAVTVTNVLECYVAPIQVDDIQTGPVILNPRDIPILIEPVIAPQGGGATPGGGKPGGASDPVTGTLKPNLRGAEAATPKTRPQKGQDAASKRKGDEDKTAKPN